MFDRPLDRRHMLATTGLALAGLTTACATTGRARPGVATPDAVVADLQKRTFDYFWETTDAATGLAPDRWPTPSFSSIAAVGFALTAYPVGVANGWITRTQARDRTLTTLRFLYGLPQGPEPTGVGGYKGFFYHFLDKQGHRFRRTELSSVDTTLLLGGVLFAGGWFDAADPAEAEIRDLANRIYARCDWRFFQDQIAKGDPRLSMGWEPKTGFVPRRWYGYTEAMLVYILGIGSPVSEHAIGPETWAAWCGTYGESWRGEGATRHLAFAPQFGHQYSHCFVDFRGIRDAAMGEAGFDYFENSRRATYWQRDYATTNPGGFAGYGADIWGITACDGPGGVKRTYDTRERGFRSYSARGPVGLPDGYDDGTLAPTAAAGSFAFAPEIVAPAIAAMRQRYGTAIYGKYGFLDSFNPTLIDGPVDKGRIVDGIGWVDNDYLGIDQGPIVAMIENARSDIVWRVMRANPSVRRGLQRAGFTGGWLG